MFNKLHPDAATVLIGRGLLAQDSELEAHIGKCVRFEPWTADLGTIARDYDFEIVGVQRDYRGKPVWRVLCLDGHDNFGRCADPEKVRLVDRAEARTGAAAADQASSAGPEAAPRAKLKLTEPQQCLVDSLRAGAQLRHDQTSGKFRLRQNGRERSVQPQTVMALVRMQVLYKDVVGGITLGG